MHVIRLLGPCISQDSTREAEPAVDNIRRDLLQDIGLCEDSLGKSEICSPGCQEGQAGWLNTGAETAVRKLNLFIKQASDPFLKPFNHWMRLT